MITRLRRLLRRVFKPPFVRAHKSGVLTRAVRWLYPPGDSNDPFHYRGFVKVRAGQLLVDSTNWVGYSTYIFGEYSPVLHDLFEMLIRPGMTVFDVGANIGDMTLTMAGLVGPTGRVHAFEPFATARNELVQTCIVNRLSNVVVHDCALSNDIGETDLHTPLPGGGLRGVGSTGITGMSSLVRPKEPYMQRTEFLSSKASVMTIDEMAMRHNLSRIDFIKIDTEGFDALVIEGGLRSIRTHNPYIIFEYDRIWQSRTGRNLQDAISMLPDYVFYGIRQSPRTPLVKIEDASQFESGDVLAAPTGSWRA